MSRLWTMRYLNSLLTQLWALVFEGPHSLWYETSTFTFLSSIRVLREEQLWAVQDVHEHRELSLDQRPQAVLQCWHYVLQSTVTHSQVRHDLKLWFYYKRLKHALWRVHRLPVNGYLRKQDQLRWLSSTFTCLIKSLSPELFTEMWRLPPPASDFYLSTLEPDWVIHLRHPAVTLFMN